MYSIRMETIRIFILFVFIFITTEVIGQELTPIDDKIYLDTIQSEINGDVADAKEELVKHAKGVGEIAQAYARAKLTQNIFRALRVLAVKELEQMPKQYRIREPRQDEAEGSGGDDEDSAEGSSSNSGTAETVGSTTKRTVPLIPVLAGILKSVFGGGENGTSPPLNVTHTLQHATKLIFLPISVPFRGVSNIFNLRRSTPAPPIRIKYVPVPIYSPSQEPMIKVTPVPTTVKTTTPILRLVGRTWEHRRPRSVNIEVAPMNPQVNDLSGGTTLTLATTIPVSPSKSSHGTIYPNMNSIYAPAYPNFPINPTPEAPPPQLIVAPPTLTYAPNHMPQHLPIYAPNHHLPTTTTTIQKLPIQQTRVEISSTMKPKPAPPQQIFIPVFAETLAEPKPSKVSVKTEPPVVVTTSRNENNLNLITTTTQAPRIITTTTLGTTEAPKPGLIYVDSLARDVQTGFDGLVKNLPDILKGAKEAIGLLANLREIFGEGEDI